jgi:hypothetical protein
MRAKGERVVVLMYICLGFQTILGDCFSYFLWQATDSAAKSRIHASCEAIILTVERLSGLRTGSAAPPKQVSSASTAVVKTFANLRQTDPELAATGLLGRDFTRAQTLLERSITEIKQGMMGEAEVSNVRMCNACIIRHCNH